MLTRLNLSDKRCSQCQKSFPATLDFFNKEKRNKLGLSSYCRECNRALSRVAAIKRYATSKGLSLEEYILTKGLTLNEFLFSKGIDPYAKAQSNKFTGSYIVKGAIV